MFGQVANLLNLEVDLLFFDTTSTYFELEDPDEPVARDDHGHPLPDHRRRARTADGEQDGQGAEDEANRVGFRTYGKSKDSRDDLPADRDRDGGDPRRDPGAGVVLARQHRTTPR